MTERLGSAKEPEKDVTKAKEFYNLHVREYSEEDFVAYRNQIQEQWFQYANAAIDADEPVYPMWARRNGGGDTFWGACVDYMMPIRGGTRVHATINISSDGGPTLIEVQLPQKDGSGEPIGEFKELYNLETLEQAIEFAESAVPPRKLRRVE